MPNTMAEPMEVDECVQVLDVPAAVDLGFFDLPTNDVRPIIYGPFQKLVCSDWQQCGLHDDVLQAFNEMNIREMTMEQKYSFPYLMSDSNIAFVGASKGKSFTYLTSIISVTILREYKIENPIIGPSTIILTNSLESCFELENHSKTLLYFAKAEKKINVVVVDPYILKKNIKKFKKYECDILISTPSNLMDLLSRINNFSLLAVRHFVFDNIDLLIDHSEFHMITVIDLLKEQDNFKSNLIQFISTSVKWTIDMHDYLCVLFKKWQYVFGCYLQASCYINMEFLAVHCQENKLKIISWYLTNNFTHGRSVLVTSNSDELGVMYTYFMKFNPDIDVFMADQDLTLEKWNNRENQCLLICSDDMVSDCYIDNADYLLHFDIPVKEYKFEERFCFLHNSNDTKPKKNMCSSYVFINNSGKDYSMLPKVCDVMTYFGDIDCSILQLKKQMLRIQQLKTKRCLCINLQQFGKCPLEMLCKDRHFLVKELDQLGSNVPRCGFAEIQILNVYDASHMFGKILRFNETQDAKGIENWRKVEDNSNKIKFKLNLYYSRQQSKITLKDFELGDMVAVELKIMKKKVNQEYFRAVVIDIIDENSNNPKVKVKLIDVGLVEIVSKMKVFVLPHYLEKMERTTVDVFLLSVKPSHFDKIWSSRANKTMNETMEHYNSVIVNVQFGVGHTIWINKMHGKFFSPLHKKIEFESVLPEMLFSNDLAVLNTVHLNQLKELINSANFYLEDRYIPFKGMLWSSVMVKWEHLDENITMIDIVYMISPSCFFLRLSKKVPQLNKLHKYINDTIAHKNVREMKNVYVRAYGLALHTETKQYSRIQVYKKVNAACVVVFFVDYGEFETKQNRTLLTINSSLIALLPFQAIECSLLGTDYHKSSNYDLTDDSKLKLNIDQLNCEVVDVVPATFTLGLHFKVILYEKDINVNCIIEELYHDSKKLLIDKDNKE